MKIYNASATKAQNELLRDSINLHDRTLDILSETIQNLTKKLYIKNSNFICSMFKKNFMLKRITFYLSVCFSY